MEEREKNEEKRRGESSLTGREKTGQRIDLPENRRKDTNPLSEGVTGKGE